jgi:PilZ domain
MGGRGIKPETRCADTGFVSESPVTPSGPTESDIVEIIHPASKTHVKARVCHAAEGGFVLQLGQAASIPHDAAVRWYDGESAWQASSQIVRISETSVNCQLAPPPEWEPAPVRQSLRAAVDNAPMLVRLATGRRVHAVCLDVSASGCRASWPAPAPTVGDAVDVAWELGDWNTDTEPRWIPARVARVVARSFGARNVGFQFTTTDPPQTARIRDWHQAWLHEHRRRLAAELPAKPVT